MYLAIDIGGTKTLLALFSTNGHCLKRIKFLTNHDQKLFEKELVNSLSHIQYKKIKTITVAVPAIVEKNNTFLPKNLPWTKFNLISIIKNIFPLSKIIMKNDADLATFYESNRIKGKTIYLTFSTGIGGGIAQDGTLTTKSSTFEPGHQKYLFNNTNTEYEHFASAKSLNIMYGKNVTELTETKILQDIANRISIGLAGIINKERPDSIVIGGPLAIIFSKYKKYLYQNITESCKKVPKIIKAKKPTESTIYGCYLYGKNH